MLLRCFITPSEHVEEFAHKDAYSVPSALNILRYTVCSSNMMCIFYKKPITRTHSNSKHTHTHHFALHYVFERDVQTYKHHTIYANCCASAERNQRESAAAPPCEGRVGHMVGRRCSNAVIQRAASDRTTLTQPNRVLRTIAYVSHTNAVAAIML